MTSSDKDTAVSTTMDRSQPGQSTASSSRHSKDTAIDFKGSEEDKRVPLGSPLPRPPLGPLLALKAPDDSSVVTPETGHSTTMDRSQPGQSTASSSRHSKDTAIDFKGSEEDKGPTMDRSQPGHSTARSSSRSLDTAMNFKGSEKDKSTTMDRSQPGQSTASSSRHSKDTAIDFKGSEEDKSPTMDRSQPGHSTARSSSRSLDTAMNFKGSEKDKSTTMDRSQPGQSTASSSRHSKDTAIDFKGSEEDKSPTMDRSQPGHSTARSSSRSLDTAMNFKGSEKDKSTTMDRSQPGQSTASSSRHSKDTAIDFKGSEEDKSPTMDRSQPGHSTARSSSRSLDTAMNFKGSEKDKSTTMDRSQPGQSTASSSRHSKDTAIDFKGSEEDKSLTMDRFQPGHSAASSSTCSLDTDMIFKGSEKDKRRQRYRARSLKSCSSVGDSLHLLPEVSDDEDSALGQSIVNEGPDLPLNLQYRSLTPDSGIPSLSCSSDSSGPPNLPVREFRMSPQYAGPADVACDQCTGKKLKALKSCLTCVRSFCEMHGRNHYTDILMDQHQLVEVTKDLNIHKQCTELKQIIREIAKENRLLREEIKSLKQSSSTPSLPLYICKGKQPTAAEVILDPETAHRALILSQDGKRVRLGSKSKVKPGPQRFDRWQCVLGKDSFTSGRHYWQVEVNKEFTIGVMKSSAKRNGHFAFAPYQGFWCIFHYWLSFSALDNHVVRLSIKSVPKVLGVCVDVDEKWVTFYNVETKEEIHTFNNMKLSPGDRIYPIFRTVEKSMDLQITTVS